MGQDGDLENSFANMVVVKSCELTIQCLDSIYTHEKLSKVMESMKNSIDGIQDFSVNILTQSIKITYNQNQCGPRDIIE